MYVSLQIYRLTIRGSNTTYLYVYIGQTCSTNVHVRVLTKSREPRRIPDASIPACPRIFRSCKGSMK